MNTEVIAEFNHVWTLLQVFLTFFSLVITFMLGGMAILLWKNESMRKDAKKDVEKINEMAKTVQILLDRVRERAAFVEQEQTKLLEAMKNETEAMKKIKTTSETDITAYKKHLNELDQAIDRSLKSITTISGTMLPGASGVGFTVPYIDPSGYARPTILSGSEFMSPYFGPRVVPDRSWPATPVETHTKNSSTRKK